MNEKWSFRQFFLDMSWETFFDTDDESHHIPLWYVQSEGRVLKELRATSESVQHPIFLWLSPARDLESVKSSNGDGMLETCDSAGLVGIANDSKIKVLLHWKLWAYFVLLYLIVF